MDCHPDDSLVSLLGLNLVKETEGESKPWWGRRIRREILWLAAHKHSDTLVHQISSVITILAFFEGCFLDPKRTQSARLWEYLQEMCFEWCPLAVYRHWKDAIQSVDIRCGSQVCLWSRLTTRDRTPNLECYILCLTYINMIQLIV